jgi:hypothetical protein
MLVTSANTVPVAAFWTRVINGRVQSLALVEGTWRVIHDEPPDLVVSVFRKAETVRDCPVDMMFEHGREKVRTGLTSPNEPRP